MMGAPDPHARRSLLAGWIAIAVVAALLAASIVWMAAREALAPPSAERAPARGPSIVLVLIDTLRADYLGTYGFAGDVSPRIDRFAQEAIVFENAFSQAPWTKPSIATLFTSLHPKQHGVSAHGSQFLTETGAELRASALPRRALTLAEGLRRAGYETAAFVANPWIRQGLGFAQGFDTFEEETGATPVFADAILAKARKWLAERSSEKPFFLYLHFMDIHGPYDPPADDVRAVQDSGSLGARRALRREELDRRRGYLMKAPWTTRPEGRRLETWRGRYAAGVRALDREIGGFLDDLAARGLLDDSVVVITSDHGEELLDHGDFDHGNTLYDEQIHVPLVVRLPGGAGGGRRVDDVVGLIDVMPTLLGLAGSEVSPKLAGRDLGVLLEGKSFAGSEIAISAGVKRRPELESVRTRTHKLVRDGKTGETALFDLAADPGESRDLSATAPQVRAALEKALSVHGAEIARSPILEKRRARVGRRTADKLRSLGYLEDEVSQGSAAHARTNPPEPAAPADEEVRRTQEKEQP